MTHGDWIERYAPGRSKALLTRIVKDGPPQGDRTRRKVTEHTATVILSLVDDCGVRGNHGRTYLVDLIRWHLGYTNLATPTGNLTSAELAFIRRRAYELVDGARDRLPMIERDREAT